MRFKETIKKKVLKSLLLYTLYQTVTTIRSVYCRNVSAVQIYTTNRCNSRCLHCKIWEYQPKTDLPVEIISKILNSRCISSKTRFCLEGGEFVLHPDHKEILRLFSGREVSLITNGILTEKLCNIVEEFKIANLIISLDGTPATYKILRGVDGYKNVIETIERLKDKVNIIIGFTLTPWNSAADYKHVKELCAKYKITMGGLNIYADQPYFMTDEPIGPLEERFEIQDIEDIFDKEYFKLYTPWLEGKIKLPCFTIFRTLIFYPEGDVFFCHHRPALLGNLYKQSLDEIWYSGNTITQQRKYVSCNKCWCSYHRRHDIFMRRLEKIDPFKILRHILPLEIKKR
ncbi:MAG: hypothetical protein DDT40_01441 [candidate division WS2 bacterium]|nr:hypothetical protein [Candidatus Psychracetigena formicireducens]